MNFTSAKWISRKTNKNDITILCKLNDVPYTCILGYKVLQLPAALSLRRSFKRAHSSQQHFQSYVAEILFK